MAFGISCSHHLSNLLKTSEQFRNATDCVVPAITLQLVFIFRQRSLDLMRVFAWRRFVFVRDDTDNDRPAAALRAVRTVCEWRVSIRVAFELNGKAV